MGLITFSATTVAGAGVYLEVIAGADFSRFGIMSNSGRNIQVAIAESLPAPGTEDWFMLSGVTEFREELTATDNVYVKSADGAPVTIRGYAVDRS